MRRPAAGLQRCAGHPQHKRYRREPGHKTRATGRPVLRQSLRARPNVSLNTHERRTATGKKKCTRLTISRIKGAFLPTCERGCDDARAPAQCYSTVTPQSEYAWTAPPRRRRTGGLWRRKQDASSRRLPSALSSEWSRLGERPTPPREAAWLSPDPIASTPRSLAPTSQIQLLCALQLETGTCGVRPRRSQRPCIAHRRPSKWIQLSSFEPFRAPRHAPARPWLTGAERSQALLRSHP